MPSPIIISLDKTVHCSVADGHLGEGGGAVVHDGAGVVVSPEVVNLVQIVLQEVELHPALSDVDSNIFDTVDNIYLVHFTNLSIVVKLEESYYSNNTGLTWMLSQLMVMWRSLSALLCSCQKPVACISSCITIPVYTQPLPRLTCTNQCSKSPKLFPLFKIAPSLTI